VLNLEDVPRKQRVVGEKYLRKGWQVIIWTGERRFTCEHGRDPYKCIRCGGPGVCEHGRFRTACKDCKGGSICEHGKIRTTCKLCEGGSLCEHKLQKSHCRQCGGSVFCEHDRYRPDCKECGGTSICEHGKYRHRCIECNGTGICEHGRVRERCVDCGGSQTCEHNVWKRNCKVCDPQNYLAHLLRTRVRSALKSSPRKLKSRDKDSMLDLIGCTVEECKKHIESQWQEGMIWDNHGSDEGEWHIDHRMPCNLFDLNNENERKKCFHYTNLQPLWATENLQAGGRFKEGFNWSWNGDEWIENND